LLAKIRVKDILAGATAKTLSPTPFEKVISRVFPGLLSCSDGFISRDRHNIVKIRLFL